MAIALDMHQTKGIYLHLLGQNMKVSSFTVLSAWEEKLYVFENLNYYSPSVFKFLLHPKAEICSFLLLVVPNPCIV